MGYSANCGTYQELPFLEGGPFICVRVAIGNFLGLPNRLQKSADLADFTPFFHVIPAAACYQNEYQTALDRYVPHYTATHGFLEYFKKNTARTQQKRPIPTLASKLQR